MATLQLHPERWVIEVDGAPVELTRAECALMRVLLNNRHRVCTDAELVAAMDSPTASVASLRTTMYRLRHKLPADTIRTIGGSDGRKSEGYMIREVGGIQNESP